MTTESLAKAQSPKKVSVLPRRFPQISLPLTLALALVAAEITYIAVMEYVHPVLFGVLR
jgi:hypothetical protein